MGAVVYYNLELYLQFERVAILFSNTPIEGTVNRTFKNESEEMQVPLPFVEYLNYMVTFVLYPMVDLNKPPEFIAKYIEQTRQLFLDGSICGESNDRCKYTQQIFDIGEPLSMVAMEFAKNLLSNILKYVILVK